MLGRMITGFMLAMGVAATGCGGPGGGISPRVACEDMQANLCERFYECYTPAALAAAGFPANEAACVTRFQADEGCAAQTEQNVCDGNERYHAAQADMCVDQIAEISCSQLRDTNFDLRAVLPACGKVCSVD
jgi:hypothetical protein